MATDLTCVPGPLLGLLLTVLAAVPTAAQGNVLMIIADDLGVDRVGIYDAHPDPGRTPIIDRLASRGVLFRNAWSNPICSPTRATLLTGRYGFRTGIGTIVCDTNPSNPGLPLNEVTLPELLAPTYSTAALGKWHLSNGITQGPTHPQSSGFGYHAGSMTNLRNSQPGGPGPGGLYFDWDKSVNGVIQRETTYATTDTVDDALRAMQALPEPWFIWVAFNAPHKPFHKPPARLHTYNLPLPVGASPIIHMQAMTEAMDTEMGRLLAPVDYSDTTIIFLGDNGTTGEATSPPHDPDRAKGTLYQGGVHVPLIIAGAAVKVPGSECAGLVNTTDVYATVSELAGYGGKARDGVSIVPYLSDPGRASIREFLYAEIFRPNGPYPYSGFRRAIRGARYKFIERRLIHEREFYDLLEDPMENDDLLQGQLSAAEAEALRNLEQQLHRLWNTR